MYDHFASCNRWRISYPVYISEGKKLIFKKKTKYGFKVVSEHVTLNDSRMYCRAACNECVAGLIMTECF